MSTRKSFVKEHWAEGGLAVVLLIGTAVACAFHKISADAAEIIDVLTAVLAIYVVSLKSYFADTATSISTTQYAVKSKTNEISSILEALSGPPFVHATNVVDHALERLRLIPQGVVRLEPSAYYLELAKTLRAAQKGFVVCAVSSMSIDRWERDPRQLNYFEENVRAINRGVSIHRVFIMDLQDFQGPSNERVKRILKEQVAANITVCVVWRESIRHDPSLYDDFVLFRDQRIVFTDVYERIDPTRVLAGYLVTNPDKYHECEGAFESLSETYCVPPSTLQSLLS